MKKWKTKILLSFGVAATTITMSSVVLSCGTPNPPSSWHDKIIESTKSFADEVHSQNWAKPEELANQFITLYNNFAKDNNIDKTINAKMQFSIKKDTDKWFQTPVGQEALEGYKENFFAKTWIMSEASYLLTFMQYYGITYPINASDNKSLYLVDYFVVEVFGSQKDYMSPACDTRVMVYGTNTLVTGMSYLFKQDPFDNTLMNWSPLNTTAIEKVEIMSQKTWVDITGHNVIGGWLMMNSDNSQSNLYNVSMYYPQCKYNYNKPLFMWSGYDTE